jgi:hypothetical protein
MYGYAGTGMQAAQRTIKLSTDNSAIQGGQFIANRAFNFNIPQACGITTMLPIIPQSCAEFDYSGINENNSLESFIAYPNPANEEINLVFPDHKNKIEINIYSVSGSLIYNEICLSQTKINTLQFPKGMYIIKAKSYSFNASKIIIIK